MVTSEANEIQLVGTYDKLRFNVQRTWVFSSSVSNLLGTAINTGLPGNKICDCEIAYRQFTVIGSPDSFSSHDIELVLTSRQHGER
jgi:hypothetical protein